jgi:hypothetical protein
MPGSRKTLTPHWKKVAGTRSRASKSSNCGVARLGPSSKVKAIARRWDTPRHTDGANNPDERERTP